MGYYKKIAEMEHNATVTAFSSVTTFRQLSQNSQNVGTGAAIYGQAKIYGNITHVHPNYQTEKSKDYDEYLRIVRTNLEKLYTLEKSLITPLPWLGNQTLDMNECFANMEMQILNHEGLFVRGNIRELSDLFENTSNEEGKILTKVLIRGDAGFGKSTLCMKVAYDWGKGIQTFPSVPVGDNLLFYIRLRDLPPGSRVEEELLKMIRDNNPRETSLEYARAALENYEGTTTVVLDGYDEALPEHHSEVTGLLQAKTGKPSVFRSALFIITSRPVINFEFHKHFDRHFRLTGLNEANTQKLIEVIFQDEPDLMSTFREILRNSTWINKLSPMLIWMLCFVHQEGDIDNADCMDDLFYKAIQLMAKRCNNRENMNLTDEKMEEILSQLGEYFLKKLIENKLLFDIHDVEKVFGDNFNFIKKSGILRKTFSSHKVKSQRVEVFEPSHKLLMECLALRCLNANREKIADENHGPEFFASIGLPAGIKATLFLSLQAESQTNLSLIFNDSSVEDNTAGFMFQCDMKEIDVKFSLQTASLQVDLKTVAVYEHRETHKSGAPSIEAIARAFPNVLSGLENLTPILRNCEKMFFILNGIFGDQCTSQSYVPSNEDQIASYQQLRKKCSPRQTFPFTILPFLSPSTCFLPKGMDVFHALLFYYKDIYLRDIRFRDGQKTELVLTSDETPKDKVVFELVFILVDLIETVGHSANVNFKLRFFDENKTCKFGFTNEYIALRFFSGPEEETSFELEAKTKSAQLRKYSPRFKEIQSFTWSVTFTTFNFPA